MKKQARSLISATLIAVLLVTTLFLSNPVSVQACEDTPPTALLNLYLQSEFIVEATITSEKDGKVLVEEHHYKSVEVERNLKVTSFLKGKSKSNLMFTQTDFRYDEEEPAAGENTSANDDIEEETYNTNGYNIPFKLKVGEKYLLFLNRNEQTNKLELTDEVSGAKQLDSYGFSVYEKRISELKTIVARKKDQLPALNEWILECLDNPVTRWDGVFMLSDSFEALNYGSEEGAEGEKIDKNKPFALKENTAVYSPKIAESLTDSQKQQISSIYFDTVQEIIFQEDNWYANFFTSIVKNWDKMRMATHAFGILQGIDKADTKKTEKAMYYIAGVVEDDKMFEYALNYAEAAFQLNSGDIAKTESQSNGDTIILEKTVEPEIENQKSESNTAATQPNEEVVEDSNKTKLEDKEKQKTASIEKRDKALQDFYNQFNFLLARGFPVSAEMDH